MSVGRHPAGLQRPSPRPIPGGLRDIPQLITRAAVERPAQEAMVGLGRRYSYAAMLIAVEAGAAALHDLGVRPGDRVAASAPNQADIMLAFLAVQRLGAVWVGVSRQIAAPEVEFQLRDCGASVLLGDAAALEKLRGMTDGGAFVGRTIGMAPGDDEWGRLIEASRGRRAPELVIDPLAPAAIAYTSGTTGRPKGAVHSQHGLLVVAAHAAHRSVAKGPDFRRAATLPLTILNIMAKEGLASVAAGGTFVVMDRLDAAGVADWIVRERVESIVCSPPTVADFVARDDIAPAAMASIQALTCGGGACPPALRDAFAAKFGKPLYVSWGLTEAPASVSGGFADECPPDSAGRIFDHLDVVVRDGGGAALPPGARGELCVRAASTGDWAGVYAPMSGYWEQPEETAAILANGELRTGDIGCVDEDRFVYILDRAKSVIIRGGQNIYPAEVERLLRGHPDVLDAAVLAMPDDRFGEVPVAALEIGSAAARETLQDELEALCARELARFKRPAAWVVLPRFPRNAMDKVNRGELRSLCLERLAAGRTPPLELP
jgi:long-chain acyl-CoA synthetase